jgi:hypothetical protein
VGGLLPVFFVKVVVVNVLLVGATIAAGVNEKKKLQRVAEW